MAWATLAGVAVVLLAVAASSVLKGSRAAITREVQASHQVTVADRADVLADALASAAARIRVNAGYDVVRMAIELGETELLTRALEQAGASPGVTGGAITDAAGRVIASAGPPMALATDDVYVFRHDRAHDDASVTISAAIVGRDGDRLGRVHQEFAVEELARQFVKAVPYGGGATWLVDRDGTVMLATSSSHPRRLAAGPLRDLVRSGRQGTVRHVSEELDTTRLSAVAPVPGTQLVAMVGSDASAVDQPASTLVWRLSGILLLTLFGMAVVGGMGVAIATSSRRTLLAERAAADHLARLDALTGTGNRRAFDHALQEARRGAGWTAIVIADLDHLKAINDTLGHEAGDRALRLVAAAMQDSVRPGDVVCRIGGDEFAVVLPETDAAIAATVADRIREGVRATELRGFGRLAASVGSHAGPSVDVLDTVARADACSYESKQRGRPASIPARLRYVIDQHGLLQAGRSDRSS